MIYLAFLFAILTLLFFYVSPSWGTFGLAAIPGVPMNYVDILVKSLLKPFIVTAVVFALLVALVQLPCEAVGLIGLFIALFGVYSIISHAADKLI